MKAGSPKVSVVLPVYNAAPHLREALDSILAQTLTDFELIVIDDCSSDATPAILDSYADRRIRRFRNAENLGIVETLNRGIDSVRGEYLARMDADDRCHPDRFRAQGRYLDEHPEIGLLGSRFITIDESGVPTDPQGALPRVPEQGSAGYLRWSLLWRTSIQHPTAMLRMSVMREHGFRYDRNYLTAEDYDLWSRMARVCGAVWLGQPLLWYRVNSQGITGTQRQRQLDTHLRIMQRELSRLMDDDMPMDLVRSLFALTVLPEAETQALPPAAFSRAADILNQARSRLIRQHPMSSGEIDAIRHDYQRVLKENLHRAWIFRREYLAAYLGYLLRRQPLPLARISAETLCRRLFRAAPDRRPGLIARILGIREPSAP